MTFLMILSEILLFMLMIDMWQQLELAPELESDLRDTEDWRRKWVVDYNIKKTQLDLLV